MRIALAFNLAVIIFGTFLFVGPFLREEFDWNQARRENTAAAYHAYLRTWPAIGPQGRHVEEARVLTDDEDYQAAVAVGSIEALNAYVAVHPHGRYASQAAELSAQAADAIEDRVWGENDQDATASALDLYLALYPQGKYAARARELLDSTRWSEAEAAGVLGSYSDYLATMPNGQYAPEASRRIAAIAALDGTWTGRTSQDEPLTLTIAHGAITSVELSWAHACPDRPFGLGGIMRVPDGISNLARSWPGSFAGVQTDHRLGWVIRDGFALAAAGDNYVMVVHGVFSDGGGLAPTASGTYEVRYTDGPGISFGQHTNAAGGVTSVSAHCPEGIVGSCPAVSSEYTAAGEPISSSTQLVESRALPALPDACQPAATVTWTAERTQAPEETS
jgi:hypothetical protein